MAAEHKRQENHFDMHEAYRSIEDVELDLSRIVDACEEVIRVAEGTHLPANVRTGVIRATLSGYFSEIDDRIRHAARADTLIEAIFGGRHE